MRIILDYFYPQSNFISLVAKECSSNIPVLRSNENVNELYGLPVLIAENSAVITNAVAIAEYIINSTNNTNSLIGNAPMQSCFVRNYTYWFVVKFYQEVTKILIAEKSKGVGMPDSSRIRLAKKNLKEHLNFFSSILKDNYIGGHQVSMADFAAAGQLMVLDYYDEIMWHAYPDIRLWYSLLKSRPCFSSFLSIVMPNRKPPAHFSEIDF